MIVLDLECVNEHPFEGWFASSEAFEKQSEQHMITCPVCGTHGIKRRPSAPHVARSQTVEPPKKESAQPATPAVLAQLLENLREQAQTAEDVGDRFPEEVRDIHNGQAEERSIRGKASIADTLELLEEGIRVLPLPPAKEDLH